MIRPQQLPALRPSQTLSRPTATVGEEILNFLRAELGTVRLGRKRTDPVRWRIELMAELCDRETFQAVMSWLSSGKRQSQNTRQAYCDDIRFWAAFAAELGIVPFSLGCLAYEDVTAWRLLQEARGGSDRSVARRLSSLSSLHAYAARRGIACVNPVDSEDHRPTIDRHDTSTATPVLEVDELQAVVEASDDERDALVVTQLYTLAGRVTEMCALDIDKRLVRGRRAFLDLNRKGSKDRLLPLSPTVDELLELHIGERTSGPLLLDASGQRLDRHDVDRMLTRLGKRAGVLPGRDVTPHVLRASRITHMIDAKEPLAEIQAFADHSDPATTIGYFTRRKAGERNARLVDDTEALFTQITARWVQH
ncbi:tyrosine-type recombinase/integrase [Kitasatospora sp. NPDC059811]|uniref:tyrosine-type recombinase/integrase n=1 Tax=Streptomycetaceae TaxID=2062 RepID=UPI0007AEFDE8|nr:tyrosine-type recombinase/integrase [Streptomyces sp. MJM8645]